jgi:AAA+ superfamily predicted ATPase
VPSSAYAAFELAVRARVPLIALITPEERRAEERLIDPVAAAWREGRVLSWSITHGYTISGEKVAGPDLAAPDPLAALEVVARYPEPALFVLKDFHRHLDSTPVLRRLRELGMELPPTGKHVVLLSPFLRAPEELEREITFIDLPPPDMAELGELLEGIREGLGEDAHRVALSPSGRERMLRAALGLTAAEAESAFARALVYDGRLTDDDLGVVLEEKKQAVRRSGILEFYEAEESLEQVGGLDVLKAWLMKRYQAFSEDARAYGLPEPRGVLLLGVQGCGKSLVAKAISQAWRMPLLRLDVGRVFGKYIGESEAGIRNAIRTAEAVSPAILWIDEIEKGFAGSTSDGHDTGVSARVLGTFLTWLQEKKKPVFVLATANSIRNLPPELLRKGRFDELFFIDLPTAGEREAIFRVQFERRRRDPTRYDLSVLAAASENYTGAEIEQSINEALHDAYAAGRREPTTADVLAAMTAIVPLAVTMRESIQGMRRWAENRARRASLPVEASPQMVTAAESGPNAAPTFRSA